MDTFLECRREIQKERYQFDTILSLNRGIRSLAFGEATFLNAKKIKTVDSLPRILGIVRQDGKKASAVRVGLLSKAKTIDGRRRKPHRSSLKRERIGWSVIDIVLGLSKTNKGHAQA